jgi:hypothetical protein
MYPYLNGLHVACHRDVRGFDGGGLTIVRFVEEVMEVVHNG